MALGGGTFLSENKKLPGTYINFVSKNAQRNVGIGTNTKVITGITMYVDFSGDLYVINSEELAVTFELSDSGDLYAVFQDDNPSVVLELSENGNLYYVK